MSRAQYNSLASVVAMVPKWLPLQPMGTMEAIGVSSGEKDSRPLPPSKGTGTVMGLLKCAWRIGFGGGGHCQSNPPCPGPLLPSPPCSALPPRVITGSQSYWAQCQQYIRSAGACFATCSTSGMGLLPVLGQLQ